MFRISTVKYSVGVTGPPQWGGPVARLACGFMVRHDTND